MSEIKEVAFKISIILFIKRAQVKSSAAQVLFTACHFFKRMVKNSLRLIYFLQPKLYYYELELSWDLADSSYLRYCQSYIPECKWMSNACVYLNVNMRMNALVLVYLCVLWVFVCLAAVGLREEQTVKEREKEKDRESSRGGEVN